MNDLTKDELVAVLGRIQLALYGHDYHNAKGRTKPALDRNKVWDAETIECVDEVLVDADLSPDDPEVG